MKEMKKMTIHIKIKRLSNKLYLVNGNKIKAISRKKALEEYLSIYGSGARIIGRIG